MTLHRRLLFGAALLLGLGFLLPARSGAVQIFVESVFVHRNNFNCTARVNPLSGTIVFRCPPYDCEKCGGSDPVTCPNLTGQFNGTYCDTGAGGAEDFAPSGSPMEDGTTASIGGVSIAWGNISNNPHIQFETSQAAASCKGNLASFLPGEGPFPLGSVYENFCNDSLFFCASVGYGNADSTSSSEIAVDEMSFELFKFLDGSNPLDPGSTPPLRTFFIDSPGILRGQGCTSGPDDFAFCGGPLGPFCVLHDGNINIQGEQGKSNGTYGFRVQVKTNQTGSSGNITITAVRSYPSGATHNANSNSLLGGSFPVAGELVPQSPVTQDVMNIHVVRSSPSLVGAITPVATQPYNLTYRLSKDATMFINVLDSSPSFPLIRTVLPGIPRVGEGTPNGTLANGDSWDGRDNNGQLMPPGVYMAVLQAFARDQFGDDLANATTRTIALDTMQITDIAVQPLLEGSTSLAVLTYMLTEPATVFIDIYPPGTQFCNGINDVNDGVPDNGGNPSLPPKNFGPHLGDCLATPQIAPLKRIVEQKNHRVRVLNFWDGRDESGLVLPDGDYVFILYAALPSQRGFAFAGNFSDRRVWTTRARSGYIPITRGLVGLSQVSPSSLIIGSSPPVQGVNPFTFRYSMSRDAVVNLKILDESGTRIIKHLVINEQRPGSFLFTNTERWDEPTDDAGLWITSGTYLVQLTAHDEQFPAKVSTTTAMFAVQLFRITDIATAPLLAGTSDIALLSYQLSQNMVVGLTIYPPGTVISQSSSTWPPCLTVLPGATCGQIRTPTGGLATPVKTFTGLRAGRLRVTEPWDGRDEVGLQVPDGSYTFVLAAQSTTTPRYFASDRVFGTVTIQRGLIIFPTFAVNPDVPTLFTSSSTITLHPFSIQYTLNRQSSVTVQILNSSLPPSIVRTIVNGETRQPGLLITDVWDGRDERGNFPPPGFYTVRALASDVAAQQTLLSTAALTISFDPLQIYDIARTPLRADSGGASILYQVSEPMKTAVKIYRPNTSFDLSGNPSPPESVSLVKRIIGVKPERTPIEDIWDGTDLTQSLVPDGVYRFKIVASTDIRAIDDLTGNILNPGAIIPNRTIDEISVVRNASLDPVGDFERNTFIYPNPITGPRATFKIFMPFQGVARLRIHNVAGELVYSRDFSEQAPSFTSGQLTFDWNKVNAAGRGVARGIYYAVIRAEENLGGRNVLQTVKRFVIP